MVTRPTYLFLDTEWADVIGSELVSIALVSEDGTKEFYAERDPLPPFATDFVRHAVYPRLDRGAAAVSDAAMTAALRRFLATIHQPYVLADYPLDLQLLKYVLGGFDLPDADAAACGPIPSPVMTLMVREGLVTVLIEDWFAAHPNEAKRRHNALIDARALRMAWMAATGRIDPHWSTRR
ncbi:MAG TPA: hypothetical protein VGD21_08300 [Lysobacter sp.]